MARIMRMGLLTFIVLLGIAASFYAWRGHLSQELARASVPAEHYPPEADVNATVVVVGDSTAVGTGTTHPRFSVAGRIASAFRGVEVNNIATVGARARDVPTQLMSMGRARADVILIQVGGNDVMSFESPQTYADNLLAAVTAARARSGAVILMPAGNVGRAPFFLPPLSWLLSARARQFNFIAMRTAQATGAIFVSLFHEEGEDPFAEAPALFYAKDGLHPSEMGYALWFGELMRQARLARLVGQPERERYSDFGPTPVDSYITIRRKPMNSRWMVVHSGNVSQAAALRTPKRISNVASRRAGAQ
jgi:lysophospholipase L1-like esterase